MSAMHAGPCSQPLRCHGTVGHMHMQHQRQQQLTQLHHTAGCSLQGSSRRQAGMAACSDVRQCDSLSQAYAHFCAPCRLVSRMHTQQAAAEAQSSGKAAPGPQEAVTESAHQDCKVCHRAHCRPPSSAADVSGTHCQLCCWCLNWASGSVPSRGQAAWL